MKRTILYIDDNKYDAVIVARALAREDLAAELFAVHDGCDAADWLTATGAYADREKHPAPDLLVVDLKMPRNSGFDLMEFVQARRELKKLPIIVYTDSENPADKLKAFQLGANAYVTKDQGTDPLMTYVRAAVTTLSSTNELPRQNSGQFD